MWVLSGRERSGFFFLESHHLRERMTISVAKCRMIVKDTDPIVSFCYLLYYSASQLLYLGTASFGNSKLLSLLIDL